MGAKTSLRGSKTADPPRSQARKNEVKAVQAALRAAPRDHSETRAASLRHVMEESLSWMAPGDILILERTVSLRELVDPSYYAMLACPLCGKLDLINQRQYCGTESVMCAHNDCSCHFRIDQRQQFTYFPVN
jgi:hypothetical protein